MDGEPPHPEAHADPAVDDDPARTAADAGELTALSLVRLSCELHRALVVLYARRSVALSLGELRREMLADAGGARVLLSMLKLCGAEMAPAPEWARLSAVPAKGLAHASSSARCSGGAHAHPPPAIDPAPVWEAVARLLASERAAERAQADVGMGHVAVRDQRDPAVADGDPASGDGDPGDGAPALGSSAVGLAPLILAESLDSLATSATSVQQLESPHPSGASRLTYPIRIANASVLEIVFDARTRLSAGSTLTLYAHGHGSDPVRLLLRARGAELADARVVVPGCSVAVRYTCEQNRELAWGFKLRCRALGPRRARSEAVLLRSPLADATPHALLRLLARVRPEMMLSKETLGQLLRYLQHPRAPERERVCTLLLGLLRRARLDDADGFDWSAIRSLEAQVGWHESLCGNGVLLPPDTQALAELIIEVRVRLRAIGLTPWRSSLRGMGEAVELSMLSRWLLSPDVYEAPAATVRAVLKLTGSAGLSESEAEGGGAHQPLLLDGWTPPMDAQLVKYVEQLAERTGGSTLSLRAAQLARLRENVSGGGAAGRLLAAMPPRARCLRFAVLHRFNTLYSRLFALVHTGTGGGEIDEAGEGGRAGEPGSSGGGSSGGGVGSSGGLVGSTPTPGRLGSRLCALRHLLFLDVKRLHLHRAAAASAPPADSAVPIVRINRLRAALPDAPPREESASEHASGGYSRAAARQSVFWQLHAQLSGVLSGVGPRALCRADKAYRVNLVGEAADDHGGPYREVITTLCSELQASERLGLLCRTPNGDAFVPSPSASGGRGREGLRFLGLLFGLALRQRESQLSLSMPTVVWRYLVGEIPEPADLKGVDEVCWRSLEGVRALDGANDDMAAAELMLCGLSMSTRLSDGTLVEFVEDGAEAAVRWEEREAYCGRVIGARLDESRAGADALLRGIGAVLSPRLLCLFSAPQLETLVCGRATVDVEELRRRTKYGVGTTATQRHVRYFWATLRRFTDEQKSLFVRFAWGRARLPSTSAEWGETRFTLHTRHGANADGQYPVAHTCFFSMELPTYSSVAVCYERLLYAVTNCLAIDIDTTAGARENMGLEWNAHERGEAEEGGQRDDEAATSDDE